MKRKVLFIKGYSKTSTEERNSWKIIQLYMDYFQHIAGGAYDPIKEFIVLEEPDEDDLQQKIEELNNLDFLIVVMLGHGASKDGFQILQVQKDFIIYPGQIQFNCPQQLHIIETCRDIVDYKIDVKRINLLVPKYEYGGLVYRSITKTESRYKYEEAISKSQDGDLYLFASAPGESARDYLFIRAIIEASTNEHTVSRNKIDMVGQFFDLVKDFVSQETDGEQNPTKKGDVDFPFVLSSIWEPEEFRNKFKRLKLM